MWGLLVGSAVEGRGMPAVLSKAAKCAGGVRRAAAAAYTLVTARRPARRTTAMTRLSEYLLPTEKEPPADAEAISHKLMVRAGLIRQMGAGMWTWLPAGWRVHQRVVAIIREEIDAIGGAGDADAGAAARRAVAQDRPLRDRGAVQAHRPQGLGARARDDPRGGRHHPRRAARALLPRPAADPLPLPGQGARRAAPAGRGAAHARVRDEGLLHLRPRPGGPRGAASSCTSAPTTASCSAPGCASIASRPTSA